MTVELKNYIDDQMACGKIVYYGGKITMPKEVATAELLANVEDVRAYIKVRKEAQAAEYEAKLAAIEGLTEIRNAIHQHECYRETVSRRMQSDYTSHRLPSQPEVNVSELCAKYPRASAYVKAESYSFASNHAKAMAGKKAVKRIFDGEDYESAIVDMETEWSDYCANNID